jgi:hypothetical protein
MLKKVQNLTIYTIWHRLSLKTTSRYCPFKQQGCIEQGNNVQPMRQERNSVFPGIFVNVEVDQSHVAFGWLPRWHLWMYNVHIDAKFLAWILVLICISRSKSFILMLFRSFKMNQNGDWYILTKSCVFILWKSLIIFRFMRICI